MQTAIDRRAMIDRSPAAHSYRRTIQGRSVVWGRILTVVCAITVFSGCGATNELESPTAVRLRGLAAIYLDYVAATGHGPADWEALHAHSRNLPEFVTLALNEEGEDAYFSERDGERFVVRFGIPVLDLSQAAEIPIAFEKHGEDGERLVAHLNGEVAALDRATCQLRGVGE